MKQAVPLSRYLVFFCLAIGGCAVDLVTKAWMFSHLGMPEPNGRIVWLCEGVLGFQTSLNEGALFGVGPGLWPLFATLSLAAAVGILMWLFLFGAAHDWLLTVALGCVAAGIFGNLYDRVGLPGLSWADASHGHVPGAPVHAVRDFILARFGHWDWPTFNLADSSLVCGAALLLWHAFVSKPEVVSESEEQPTKTEELPTVRL